MDVIRGRFSNSLAFDDPAPKPLFAFWLKNPFNKTKLGSARVSTIDQNLALQLDALKKARAWLPLALPLPDLDFEAKITTLTPLINYETSGEMTVHKLKFEVWSDFV